MMYDQDKVDRRKTAILVGLLDDPAVKNSKHYHKMSALLDELLPISEALRMNHLLTMAESEKHLRDIDVHICNTIGKKLAAMQRAGKK